MRPCLPVVHKTGTGMSRNRIIGPYTMSSANHVAHILAYLRVVNEAAAIVAAHGVGTVDVIAHAISLVDKWARQGGVEDGELANAARDAWADGDAFRLSGEPALRSRMWLGVAVGNLTAMARKGRGWKETPRTILDAASAAVSSLRIDGLPRRTDFEALAAQTLADAPTKAPKRKPAAALPKPGKFGPAPALGELVAALFARRKPMRYPELMADAETLGALLRERELPVSSALFAFEDRFGGVRFAETGGEESDGDIILGAWALLKDDSATPNRERGLVPIALTSSDIWYFLDATGTVWAQDTIEEPEPVPFASSTTTAIARLLLYQRAFDDRHKLGYAELEGHSGSEVATKLGLPPVQEASDEFARFWGDARTLVIEHDVEDEAVTLIVGRAATKFVWVDRG